MDDQIEKLEEFAADAKERLVRLETRTEAMAANIATKADIARLDERIDGLARLTSAEFAQMDARIAAEIARLEATPLKWFVGTAIAMTGMFIASMQLFR